MGIVCRKCMGTGFYLQQRGMQVGMYCDNCGAWIKWAPKKELDKLVKYSGYKIYPENMEVTVKKDKDLGTMNSGDIGTPNMGTPNMGTSNIGVSNMGIQNMGVQRNENEGSINREYHSVVAKPLESISEKSISEEEIEQEVERRVTERLNQIKLQMGNNGEDVGYCPICDGTPLTPEGQSRVEVTIYSGAMTITDPEGLNVYGMYKLKRCPYCGKIFSKD